MSNIEIFASDRATNYDNFTSVWVSNYTEFMQTLPSLLQSDLVQTEEIKEVLVVGCGTGNEIKALTDVSETDILKIDTSKQYHITGIDPSPQMIAQAINKLNFMPNVTLIEGVVSDLESCEHYDVATLLLVLHFIADNGGKLALLQDIASQLKPNGLLIVLDIAGDKSEIKTNLALLKGLLPADIPQEMISKRLTRMENVIPHVSELRFIELCTQAGFSEPIRFFQSTIYRGWVLYKA